MAKVLLQASRSQSKKAVMAARATVRCCRAAAKAVMAQEALFRERGSWR
jgi:hypothetical protein